MADSTKKRAPRKKKQTKQPINDFFARATIPPQMEDPKQRADWGLPDNDDALGPYIVELNLQHVEGLQGAANGFVELYSRVVRDPQRKLDRIAKTYYNCSLSVKEWRQLVILDESEADARASAAEKRAGEEPAQPSAEKKTAAFSARYYRCIFRIWPDFLVQAHVDKSVMTVKADAAFKAFDAGGEGIVWAIIDSGVQVDHPHFGDAAAALSGDRKAKDAHLLLADEVAGLHRCFCEIPVQEGSEVVRRLDSPDIDPERILNPPQEPGVDEAARAQKLETAFQDWRSTQEQRPNRVAKHRAAALSDPFGHGTHVAGIVAGGAGVRPDGPDKAQITVYERQFKTDQEGKKIAQSYGTRKADASLLRGVAPRCKLISLRVLDENGKGRASDVMRALEYIRRWVNDDPKLLRVHGVNLSVGYEFDPEMFACGQSPLCAEVDRLVQAGVVVVAAAGNTGFGTVGSLQWPTKVALSNTINDPGNAALAITVGSTHRDAPHTYGVSYFSSKGPTGDGRLKPDLVAPGERITSCAAGKMLTNAASGADGLTVPETKAHAPYVDDTGTSMAAPHVSGAVAAFLSIRREFVGKPLEVKQIFLDSATPLGRERYFEGHGLVDLMRAIQSV